MLLSVVTAVFNAEKYIQETIDSVSRSVTLGNFDIEHIVIDDCSTDSTSDIVKSNTGVKYLKTDRNSGPARARNLAFEQARGEYFFHIDGDDVIFQNSLRYLLDTAVSKKTQWVYGDFLRSDKDLVYTQGKDYYGWPFNSVSEALQSMYTGWHFYQGNCLYSRDLFKKVGGFNEDLRIGEDFDLFTRFLLEGALPEYLPGALYIHRNHGKNLTAEFTYRAELHRENVSLVYSLNKNRIDDMLSEEGLRLVTKYLE